MFIASKPDDQRVAFALWALTPVALQKGLNA